MRARSVLVAGATLVLTATILPAGPAPAAPAPTAPGAEPVPQRPPRPPSAAGPR